MSAILEAADVALARTLFSTYRNTDIAARFVLAELHAMAQARSTATTSQP